MRAAVPAPTGRTGRRSAFPGPAALCAGQPYALLARLWRAVPTGGRRSKRVFPPPWGPRCRSEGPHRENWPAFPPRPRSPQISAIPSSRPREPREGVRYARSARSTRPAPRGDTTIRKGGRIGSRSELWPNSGTMRPRSGKSSRSRMLSSIRLRVRSPAAAASLFRVPEPQFFQVANGRLRKANETFRHGFTRCRVVSWPRQATGRVRPPDRQAPRRPLA